MSSDYSKQGVAHCSLQSDFSPMISARPFFLDSFGRLGLAQ